jgi:hypothetical protein
MRDKRSAHPLPGLTSVCLQGATGMSDLGDLAVGCTYRKPKGSKRISPINPADGLFCTCR